MALLEHEVERKVRIEANARRSLDRSKAPAAALNSGRPCHPRSKAVAAAKAAQEAAQRRHMAKKPAAWQPTAVWDPAASPASRAAARFEQYQGQWANQPSHMQAAVQVQSQAQASLKVLADMMADKVRLNENRWPYTGSRLPPVRADPPANLHEHIVFDWQEEEQQQEREEQEEQQEQEREQQQQREERVGGDEAEAALYAAVGSVYSEEEPWVTRVGDELGAEEQIQRRADRPSDKDAAAGLPPPPPPGPSGAQGPSTTTTTTVASAPAVRVGMTAEQQETIDAVRAAAQAEQMAQWTRMEEAEIVLEVRAATVLERERKEALQADVDATVGRLIDPKEVARTGLELQCSSAPTLQC